MAITKNKNIILLTIGLDTTTNWDGSFYIMSNAKKPRRRGPVCPHGFSNMAKRKGTKLCFSGPEVIYEAIKMHRKTKEPMKINSMYARYYIKRDICGIQDYIKLRLMGLSWKELWKVYKLIKDYHVA